MFDNIVNWKLKKGSHDFPGPDGGTCINEAAIVAAGFEYKKIDSVRDCPPCFSRPIAAYAIKLNDSMPNDLRQELLMPFVTRLSGTADTKEMEIKRAQFMALESCRRIMSELCIDVLKRPDLAEECRAVKTLKEAEDVCRNKVRMGGANANANANANAVLNAADALNAAAAAAVYAAAAAAAAAPARRKYYTIACQILDGAILLGKHTALDTCAADANLQAAKIKTPA